MAKTKKADMGSVALEGLNVPSRSLVIVDEHHHMRGRKAWSGALRRLASKAVESVALRAIESGVAKSTRRSRGKKSGK